ncbi:MAG TPA: hypothetical protein VLE23_16485, partial [Geminicoccaceae bacterium]|nr:hypothetical protein [Geminicoccaceae bacterium]
VGLIYLRLHALPEHLAHGASKVQLQLVGVLALLAMFTHNHIFWIAALLLALVKFPNFSAPLASMAQSLEKLASHGPPQGTVVSTPAEEAAPQPAAPAEAVPTKAGPTGKAPIEQTKREPTVPETVA